MRASVGLQALAAVLSVADPVAARPKRQILERELAYSEPHYPSPWMDPGTQGWQEAYQKAADFVSQLTLLEKVNLTTGVGWMGERCVGNTGSIPRLGMRGLCLQDGPVGVRLSDWNSVFPSAQVTAATFDRGLFYARGRAIGAEQRGKGVDVVLAPASGPLGRHPDGGRIWEGFSPDPYLSGVGMAHTIAGIQDAGVVACAKHFIANEQEHFRQVGESLGRNYTIRESLSSNVDDRTMHELYLWPFADAVRAGVGSVMCSYQQINNSYGCQNSKILNGLLKDELGFQGFVVSDWGAQHTGSASAMAGLDMSMPGDQAFDSRSSFWGGNLTQAVLNGTVPAWRIDDMAMRIMAGFFKVGMAVEDMPDINFSSWTLDTHGPVHAFAEQDHRLVNQHVDVRGSDHAALIRDIAARGTVLLKNAGGALPLDRPRFVAVVGEDAGPGGLGPNGCADRGCNSGTLGMSWGSGTANFPYLVTPDAALQAQALADGSRYESVLDNRERDATGALVRQADVTAIVFVNANSGEGYIDVDGNAGDRKNLTLWGGGDALVKNVSSVCPNTIVVIHSTGPVVVADWHASPNVTAILWAGVPGQESGRAIADVLYGRVNPAARTPFTWGPTLESYGVELVTRQNNGDGAPQADFTEGVFIDYRHFDRASARAGEAAEPIFEFGFGLSYTTFDYSDLRVEKVEHGDYVPASGTTAPAPTALGRSFGTDPSAYQVPAEISRVDGFVYPYLDDTTGPTAGGGNPDFLPPGASSSEPRPRLRSSGGQGGNPGLWDVLYIVRATVRNTGSRAGEDVPQLYVSLGDGTGADGHPVRMLRGFERLSIPSGREAVFEATLKRRDVSFWDPTAQDWIEVPGEKITVWVGASSRKLPLSTTLA